MVATFHGVENLTVNGGIFITNLTDIPVQVQSARAPSPNACSGEQELACPFRNI